MVESLSFSSKEKEIDLKDFSKSLQSDLTDTTAVFNQLLKERMQLPAIVIGSYFNRDHAGVLHHLKAHEILYKTYFDYRILYDKANKRLDNNEYVENDMYECINNMLIRIELLEKKVIAYEKTK